MRSEERGARSENIIRARSEKGEDGSEAVRNLNQPELLLRAAPEGLPRGQLAEGQKTGRESCGHSSRRSGRGQSRRSRPSFWQSSGPSKPEAASRVGAATCGHEDSAK